ncbi:MAG: hypothetical protein Q4D32_11320 [Eubacteriales bacterium]|nr:hypothetical protein [Eubacteriales bacterium]
MSQKRTMMRTQSNVLNGEPYEMPDKAKGLALDTNRLNSRIRRMVRKYLTPAQDRVQVVFQGITKRLLLWERGIYLVSRIPKRRVFVPLGNNEQYDRQILFIFGKTGVVLHIPVETKIKKHGDYTNIVFMYIENKAMFTLSDGTVYGETLGQIVFLETLRLDLKNQERGKLIRKAENCGADSLPDKAEAIENNNLVRQKYDSRKAREWADTIRYINTEINWMLREEKPTRIVIPSRVLKDREKHYSRTVNLTRSFQGYVRERLAFKCRLHFVELMEIGSKGTGSLCAVCGAEGKGWKDEFVCESCGSRTTIALNSAKNVEKKYKKMESDLNKNI